MKKSILLLSLTAATYCANAQTKPTIPVNVVVKSDVIINLSNKLDTVISILSNSDLKASQVSYLIGKMENGRQPLLNTIRERMQFVADSISKSKVKEGKK